MSAEIVDGGPPSNDRNTQNIKKWIVNDDLSMISQQIAHDL